MTLLLDTRRSLSGEDVAVSAVSGWKIEAERAHGRSDSPEDL